MPKAKGPSKFKTFAGTIKNKFLNTSGDGRGLSLSGGGARGLVHIGAWKYIQEKGISIKEVSGTSMGAIIAACIATNMDYNDMIDVLQSKSFKRIIKYKRTTLFTGGEQITQFLGEIFGDKNIQDTDISLTIVATDINTGKQISFKKGKIVPALRASIGVPGVFKPYNYQNKFLVDGGLVNNLPVNLLTTKNIIAISANKRDNLDKIINKKITLSTNKDILLRSFVILMRENEYNIIEKTKKQGKNIKYLQQIKQFSISDFQPWQEIVDSGYNLAKKELSNL